MKLKLTYLRPGGDSVDLVATVDATVTVGELANAVLRRDPIRQAQGERAPSVGGRGDQLSLRVHPDHTGGQATLLSAGLTLSESGLRSGRTVSLASVTGRWQDARAEAGSAAATLTVLSGPDSGKTFPLRDGTSFIGRDSSCEVRLSDALVSKKHARITITDVAEVTDLGSANGMMLAGTQVNRATLRPQDRIILGDTSFGVTIQHRARSAVAASTDLNFNRSPRLDPTFPGEEFEAPEPPQLPEPPKLPIIGLIAPILMGVVLFAVMQSVVAIVFIALSPLLLFAGWWDGKRQAKKAEAQADKKFAESLAALNRDLAAALLRERAGRLSEFPSTVECLDAITLQSGLLWTRRTEHDRFLTVQLGIGTQPSRHSIEMPSRSKAEPRHWDQLVALRSRYANVADVPVSASFAEAGSIGIAAEPITAVGLTRGVVLQLAALHSPADLTITALLSDRAVGEWAWLSWLPHCGGPHSPVAGSHLASEAGSALRLMAELEELIEQRQGKKAATHPTVVVVIDDDAPAERARLIGLAERGPAVGVHVLWFSGTLEQLPAACRTFLVAGRSSGQITAGYVHTAVGITPLVCQTVNAPVALTAARVLAPITDAGARVEDASDLPRSVSFLSLLGPELAAEAAVVAEKWRESESIIDRQATTPVRRRNTSLRALVGQAATEPLTLDLRTQGPHALVGGTTGAGKSEFLQSWVLGMAAAYSPDTLTFLFVDYKGGTAFAECIKLPHFAGLVTDLTPHLVKRALTSFNAELKHREHILNAKKAKDLLELQKSGDPDAPPSLVIVVDEFAALVQEVPEFVDGMVNIAQRGRSLGLHLILATQRPAGVIKDNLRANTNLRVALRMADGEDSSDVLGVPDAAEFSPDIPGRAAVKAGPGRITSFQTGYAGGWTTDEAPPSQLELAEIGFGQTRLWEDTLTPRVDRSDDDLGPTDIARLVTTITAAAELAEIPTVRRPWLDDLVTSYDLQFLGPRRDTELVLGVVDLPAEQDQRVAHFLPDTDGNMAIYGGGGSGKTTALRTLAAAAGITPRSGPCHVYALDFASGGLRILETMPHVGAVIPGDDLERVTRLLTYLKVVIDERVLRYGKQEVGTITEYRDAVGDLSEPRILVLVDGFGTFRNDYDAPGRYHLMSLFNQLAADGRSVGVHFVVTADRAGTIPATLSSSIQRRLVLRLADENDYAMLDIPHGILNSTTVAGRGVLDGKDIQIAVLGGKAGVSQQARAFDKLGHSIGQRLAARPQTIGKLGDLIRRPADLPASTDRLWLGVAGDDLQPVSISAVGTFLVSGPPASGRTSALVSLTDAWRAARPQAERYYLGNKRSAMARSVNWTASALDATEVEELAAELATKLANKPPALVVVEGLSDFLGAGAEMALVDLVTLAKTTDHLFVGESEASTLMQHWSILQEFKAARRGMALQPDQLEGETVYRTPFPSINRAEYPSGRGLLVESGKVRRVQLYLPEA